MRLSLYTEQQDKSELVPLTMTRTTERQQEADALLEAFIVQLIAEAEIEAYRNHSDSDSDSSDLSGSNSSPASSSSDSMEVDDGITDTSV
jgi:hypothetical protein